MGKNEPQNLAAARRKDREYGNLSRLLGEADQLTLRIDRALRATVTATLVLREETSKLQATLGNLKSSNISNSTEHSIPTKVCRADQDLLNSPCQPATKLFSDSVAQSEAELEEELER